MDLKSIIPATEPGFYFITSQLPFPRQPDNQLPRFGDHLDLLPGLKSQLRHPVALKGNGR